MNLSNQGTLSSRQCRAVLIGDEFIIPAGSTVSGKVLENQTHELTIVLTDLKTPSGTDTPIDAFPGPEFHSGQR